jgi:hypothetical protein
MANRVRQEGEGGVVYFHSNKAENYPTSLQRTHNSLTG